MNINHKTTKSETTEYIIKIKIMSISYLITNRCLTRFVALIPKERPVVLTALPKDMMVGTRLTLRDMRDLCFPRIGHTTV